MPCKLCGEVGHNKRTCEKKLVEPLKESKTPTKVVEIEDDREECPICYNPLGDTGVLVTKCGHKFCTGCIPKHLANSNSCPMCRGDIFDEPIVVTRPAHGPGSISQITDHTFRFGYDQGHHEGYQEGRGQSGRQYARVLYEATTKIQEQDAEIARLKESLELWYNAKRVQF